MNYFKKFSRNFIDELPFQPTANIAKDIPGLHERIKTQIEGLNYDELEELFLALLESLGFNISSNDKGRANLTFPLPTGAHINVSAKVIRPSENIEEFPTPESLFTIILADSSDTKDKYSNRESFKHYQFLSRPDIVRHTFKSAAGLFREDNWNDLKLVPGKLTEFNELVNKYSEK
jgi:hypothetical protein